MSGEKPRRYVDLAVHWEGVTRALEDLQKNVGFVSTHVTGAALAIHRLARIVTVAMVVMTFAFMLTIALLAWTVHEESARNHEHRRHEAIENAKLREEIWGAISLLTSHRCGRAVSASTNP